MSALEDYFCQLYLWPRLGGFIFLHYYLKTEGLILLGGSDKYKKVSLTREITLFNVFFS